MLCGIASAMNTEGKWSAASGKVNQHYISIPQCAYSENEPSQFCINIYVRIGIQPVDLDHRSVADRFKYVVLYVHCPFLPVILMMSPPTRSQIVCAFGEGASYTCPYSSVNMHFGAER